jgi:hypothetical protein
MLPDRYYRSFGQVTILLLDLLQNRDQFIPLNYNFQKYMLPYSAIRLTP